MFEQMLEMPSMISDSDCSKGEKPRDLEAAQIREKEDAAQKVLTSMSHFTNPWRIPNKDKLFFLALGAQFHLK